MERYQTIRKMEITKMLCFLPVLFTFMDYTYGCHFPEYMQSNGTMRDWKSKIRNQGAEISMNIEFDGSKMRAVATDTFGKSYTRLCIKVYGGGEHFLVAHEERGQREGRYTCMQFVERGNGVIQIKEAPLAERMNRKLCHEDKFQLNDWLLIDMVSAPENREVCSLKGGFDTTTFDKGNMQAYCDVHEGETRVESECVEGESMTFYSRRQGCVSEEMYMYSTQKTFCLANWNEGMWNFILLKHDRLKYMWVMRYPNNGKDRFTTYIFRNLYAPMTMNNRVSNYLHISMTRKPASDGMPLCFDDYAICTVMRNPCTYNEKMAITCSKTCNICNNTTPSECNLSTGFQGRWAEASDPKRTAIVIDGPSVSFGTEESMSCVNWGPRSALSKETVNGVRELMLVSRTSHGCRPRYSCVRISQVSPSVMFIQISQWRSWPLIDNPTKKIDCTDFDYEAEKSTDPNKFRSKNSHLLVSRSINATTQCDLDAFRRFDILFHDGVRCSGELGQPETKDSVNFSLPACPVQRLRDTYTCIEYARYPPANDLLLVTRSSSDTGEIHCWIFPKRPTNIFHLIPASQCNELSKRRIRKGRLRPIATFTKPRRRMLQTKSIIVENSAGVINQSDSTINVIEYIGEDTTRTNTTLLLGNITFYDVTEDNSNTTSLQDDSEPSPLVVTAVVITMVAVHLTLLCTCKCWS